MPADKTIVEMSRRAIIALVDLFQKISGVADSTIGRLALGDSEFLTRLRSGENVTTEKLQRLEVWIGSADPHAKWNTKRPRAPKKPKA